MAEDIGLDRKIRKREDTSLQKFKNQNTILKKFDKPGLDVYRAIRKNGIMIGELLEKTKMGQKELFEILVFLKKSGMIETVEEAPAGGEKVSLGGKLKKRMGERKTEAAEAKAAAEKKKPAAKAVKRKAAVKRKPAARKKLAAKAVKGKAVSKAKAKAPGKKAVKRKAAVKRKPAARKKLAAKAVKGKARAKAPRRKAVKRKAAVKRKPAAKGVRKRKAVSGKVKAKAAIAGGEEGGEKLAAKAKKAPGEGKREERPGLVRATIAPEEEVIPLEEHEEEGEAGKELVPAGPDEKKEEGEGKKPRGGIFDIGLPGEEKEPAGKEEGEAAGGKEEKGGGIEPEGEEETEGGEEEGEGEAAEKEEEAEAEEGGEEIEPEAGPSEEEEVVPLGGESAISPEEEFGIGGGGEGEAAEDGEGGRKGKGAEPGEEVEAEEEPAEKGEGDEAEGGEEPAGEEEEAGEGKEGIVPEAEPSEEEEVVPLDLGEEGEEAPAGKEEEETPEEGGGEGEEFPASEDEIAPESDEGGGGAEGEEDEDIFLTPGEKKIKGKYGERGIEVYNLIDGQRTAEEIMRSTGVTEKTLIEMLDFMEKEGIIKLEHPGAKKPKARPPGSAEQKKEVGFAPMLEEQSTPEKPLGGVEGKAFTLDVPKKLGGGMLKEIQAKTNIMLKFKQSGVKVLEMINGKRDVVELSLKSGLPLYTVYAILGILEKDGVVKLEPSVRSEIQRKYGEDGYSVYKRYGREGVMLYQLIGKDMDLRTMARQTSKDNVRIVEIFMFIHKLLGIELPIDDDVLLERLGAGGASETGKE